MIKKLMKSIREYKRDSILTPFFVSLEVVMEVIIPLLMAMLIDYGIGIHMENGDLSGSIRHDIPHIRGTFRQVCSQRLGRICKESEKRYVL